MSSDDSESEISLNYKPNPNPHFSNVFSLIKYNEPVLLTKGGGDNNRPVTDCGAPMTAGSFLDPKKPIEEILNLIDPPDCWEEDGIIWRQTLSDKKCSRQEIIELHKNLKDAFYYFQARNVGFCPIRRELYRQCFDELIRQCTLECPTRGLLLLRIRDEALYTMRAYEALYGGSIDFGLNKANEEHRKTEEVRLRVEQLEEEATSINEQIKTLRILHEQDQLRAKEAFEGEERLYKSKVEFLTKVRERYQATLTALEEKRRETKIKF